MPKFKLPGTLGIICDSEVWERRNQLYPLFEFEDFLLADELSEDLNFVKIKTDELEDLSRIEPQLKNGNVVLILESDNNHAVAEIRRYVIELM